MIKIGKEKIRLKGAKVSVVGVSGMEGSAATKFLLDKGAEITGHDFANKKEFKENFFKLRDYLTPVEQEKEWGEFDDLDIELKLKDEYLTDIENSDLIFLPQAWFRYPFNNKLKKLKDNLPIIGILDLYFNFTKAKIVGITGSSGKSTVSKMVYQMLKKKYQTLLSGNDRATPPVLDKIEDLDSKDWLILEISNRQLVFSTHGPDIGVIINLFPTHLDDHPDFQAYKLIKAKLIKYQTNKQSAVLNKDDKEVKDLARFTSAKKYYFSLDGSVKNGMYLKDGKGYWGSEELINFNKVKVPGKHNQANFLAAGCVARIAGVENDKIKEAAEEFTGLKHRLELVAEKERVKYYEDSQSTNALSTIAALGSFSQPMILIAGGKGKPNPKDFAIMAQKGLSTENLKKVILIGESAPQIKDQFKRFGTAKELNKLDLSIFRSLKEATDYSSKLADDGDVVLLSPGCESFGEFKDYRERGEIFHKLVKKL